MTAPDLTARDEAAIDAVIVRFFGDMATMDEQNVSADAAMSIISARVANMVDALVAAERERDALREQLTRETDEYDRLLSRYVRILREVNHAVKGDPGPLRIHGVEDTAQVTRRVVRERDAWTRLVVALDNQGTHESLCLARDIGGLVCAGCEAVDSEAADARAAVNTEARTDG